MGKAIYLQRGESIDYANTTSDTIEAGDVVVVGSRVGVAGCDMVPAEIGSLHVEGVFTFQKPAGLAIAAGDEVKWDAASETAGTTGVDLGFAMLEAKASDELVHVKINA